MATIALLTPRLRLENHCLRRFSGNALSIELMKVPKIGVDITTTSNQFIEITDVAKFKVEMIPRDAKSVLLLTYKQGAYVPSHGVQICLNNLNGSDPQNQIGYINVHDSDRTRVGGTFDAANTFFASRATRRGWLQSTATSWTTLLTIVFPLTIWILFRLTGILPTRFSEIPLLTFGMFVYVFAACYWAFDRFLRYALWTFPRYELEFSNQRFLPVPQTHRCRHHARHRNHLAC